MLPLSESDQRLLLRLARRTLEKELGKFSPDEPEELPSSLSVPSGAFVSLHQGSALRGCVGRVEPVTPLSETVAECAVAAALRDPRFPPVGPSELNGLRIQISVLSPPFDVTPETIEVGRHGLFISKGFHRGVLLPQVAVEWHWDRQRFLEETCRKASLPKDAWHQGASIQAFTTQILEEDDTLIPVESHHPPSFRAPRE